MIDLVYLWVDGQDPEWRRRHNEAVGKGEDSSSADGVGRYANNNELKYSLRAAEKYAPWIRKIHIVTDRQVPDWLDVSHPKIHIVDHSEILPAEVLPTFNSNVIEHALHRIPELSEKFLYANDDMFFNREVKPEDFFTPEGLPIVRLNRRPFRKFTLWFSEKVMGRTPSFYNRAIRNAAELVEKKSGKYIGGKTHHNIDAYCRSQYAATYDTFREAIEPTLCHRVRSEEDIQRNIYSYWPIAEKKCRRLYVTRHTSFRLHTHKRKHYEKLMRWNPLLFCVNDSEFASDDDRKFTSEFLETRFPEKSSFEK